MSVPPTVSVGVTVHGDTHWLYQATTPLQKHLGFILCLFLGGRLAEVVLFCISNPLVIKNCTAFETMAPKSQKKNQGGVEQRGFSESITYVKPNFISLLPSSFLHHM